MRKLLMSGALAAVLAVSLVAPAFASFDPHFKVITKGKNARHLGNGRVAFNEKVLDPHRLQNKVGYDRGVCKPDGPVAYFCKATYHLDGEIGGHGDISVAGKIFQGQEFLSVVHGTGDFAGAEGTVAIEPSDLGNRYGIQIFDLH